jgi:DNA-binding NtrC family response regulator
MASKILIVDDEPFNLDLLEQELAELGYATERANNGAQALQKIARVNPALVLLDYQMPDMNGIEVLRNVRQTDNDLPIVLITAHGSIERAVEAVKAGADDYITKPFDPEHLAMVVKKALDRAQLKQDVEYFAQELGGFHRWRATVRPCGHHRRSEKAAASKSTVLLLGRKRHGQGTLRPLDSTGRTPVKTLRRHQLRRARQRAPRKRTVRHEKGAFTGAHQLKKGKLEFAQGGTVFLTRSAIWRGAANQLLRVCRNAEFERVGGTTKIAADLRIMPPPIAISKAVSAGTFRADLFTD